jgi:hypothetical protein
MIIPGPKESSTDFIKLFYSAKGNHERRKEVGGHSSKRGLNQDRTTANRDDFSNPARKASPKPLNVGVEGRKIQFMGRKRKSQISLRERRNVTTKRRRKTRCKLLLNVDRGKGALMEVNEQASSLGESRENKLKIINAAIRSFDDNDSIVSVLKNRARQRVVEGVRN